MSVRVVTAGFDDLDPRTAYALWRLRQQVFVVEQSSPYPDLDGRDLEETTTHLLLLEDDRLIGCARVVDDVNAVRIGRVVVAPAARGRRLATLLVDEAMRQVGDRAARLDAQTGLTRFYASYGFVVSGPEFDEDGVLHVPMERPAAI
ncbi:MAG: ElaA protein [uncultured Nocardioides sp.]|uniref:ElaA protein n=1 Tax=uncultured Nocardioides sp. TaxID=198441 RepID=A0A6J4MXC1_9ACTN|nr:MAG: ElaA protein [uncultured Nocardioides sp.]